MVKSSRAKYIVNVLPLPEPEIITIDDDADNEDKDTSASPELSLLRLRERPAQQKYEFELVQIRKRLDELRSVNKSRDLAEAEVRELEKLLFEEFNKKRKLKKAIDAATRSKRYRLKRSLTSDSMTPKGNSKSIRSKEMSVASEFQDLRPSSTSCFGESFANAASMLAKLATSSASNPPSNSPPTTQDGSIPTQLGKRPHSSTPPTQSLGSEFKCSQCDSVLPSLNAFVSHMKTQHLRTSPTDDNNTIFQCHICKAVFPTPAAKITHAMEHFVSTNTQWTCQPCGKAFESAKDYRQHHATVHTEVLQRCRLCLKVFTQATSYNEHMIQHAVQEHRYSCISCKQNDRNLIFDSQELLEAHVQLVHDRPDSTNPVMNSFMSLLPAQSPAKCPRIADTNASNLQLVPSVMFASISGGNGKALKCFVCDKDCPNENALDEHRLMHHCKVPKGNRCAICRSTLTSVEACVLHAQQHADGISDMSCVICRQTIRNENQLKLHAEYHLDDSNATTSSPSISETKCSICNEQVPTTEIAAHFLNHAATGMFETPAPNPSKETESASSTPVPPNDDASTTTTTTPLICHCGQQFEDESELTTHALEHLSEALPGSKVLSPSQSNGTLYDCRHCIKRFPSLSALQGHSHVHMNSKMFKCSKCAMNFSSAAKLQQHKIKHKNRSDVKCRICDARFSSSSELDFHRLVHETNITANSTMNNKSDSKPLLTLPEALEA